jgi:hypothetical protein
MIVLYQSVEHRLLTRYDAYLNVINCTGNGNHTDFYWDERMQLNSIEQAPLFFEIGVRFALRI